MSEQIITLAIAPCAWGIWYPEHKLQITELQYCKEIESLGVRWTELGPYGFLGKDKYSVQEILDRYNIQICSGTYAYPFLQGFDEVNFINPMLDIAQILLQCTSQYLIIMDDSGFYKNTTQLQKYKLHHWEKSIPALMRAQEKLARIGIMLLFHPHAGTCIETEIEITQFLEYTKGKIPLCFDIGHHAYSGGDVCSFFEDHYSEIKYIHIKNLDKILQLQLAQQGMSVEDMFLRGVMTELEIGNIDISRFKSLLYEKQYEGFVVFEQDRFGMPKSTMLPSAKRNFEYWNNI